MTEQFFYPSTNQSVAFWAGLQGDVSAHVKKSTQEADWWYGFKLWLLNQPPGLAELAQLKDSSFDGQGYFKPLITEDRAVRYADLGARRTSYPAALQELVRLQFTENS